MLISESYRELNRKLHETRPDYGTSGQRYANVVMTLSEELKTREILDYGCGKRTLQKLLGFEIKNYDPCIAGLSDTPEPADIVVCTDVLEHIEPESLDEVLDDLKRVTKQLGFFSVATRPAKKFLADGRNAHLIQEPSCWWLPKIEARFPLKDCRDYGGEFFVLVGKC